MATKGLNNPNPNPNPNPKLKKFISEPIEGKDVRAIPGISAKSKKIFVHFGYSQAVQVLDALARHVMARKKGPFVNWLISLGIHFAAARECFDALVLWIDRNVPRDILAEDDKIMRGNNREKKRNPRSGGIVKLQKFISGPIGDKDIGIIPGIAGYNRKMLLQRGYRQAADLIDQFEKMGRDEDSFVRWLTDFSIDAAAARKCYEALKSRCNRDEDDEFLKTEETMKKKIDKAADKIEKRKEEKQMAKREINKGSRNKKIKRWVD